MTETKRKFVIRFGVVCEAIITTTFEPVDDLTTAIRVRASNQYNEERIAAGDPPYSIGNDWLNDPDGWPLAKGS